MVDRHTWSMSVIAFLAVAFGIATAVGFFILVSGGLKSAITLPALLTMMFSPSLGAILATKLVQHRSLRANGIGKGRLGYYLLAWAYPIIVILMGLVFITLLGTGKVDFNNLAIAVPSIPGMSGSALLILTVVNLLLAPFINFIPALGEEYGWRGFLQPALVQRFGLTSGLTLTGLVWGLWHAPIILQGYNYPQHPNLIGVSSFTLWTILVGYFLGWLRIRSNSCLPAALGHGAINAYAGFGLILAPAKDELLGLPLGLPAFLALALIAALLSLDFHKHTNQQLQSGSVH
jgi:membrane protease YdiL (CAAX protease family)